VADYGLYEDIPEADIVVSMGCNVVCPYIPGKLNLNWGLDDPTGHSDETFLQVMDLIEKNVLKLRETLLNPQI
jgi:arsenate reductase